MNATTKKTAIYLGGALVVGAAGFFVYSFFKKPKQETIEAELFDSKDQTTTTPTKDWTKVFSDLGVTIFNPIKSPTSTSGFNAQLWNSVK